MDTLVPPPPPPHDDLDDEFSEGEWERARLKLEAAEREMGLRLVQRNRLRRQLEARDMEEPPVMQQRFGSLPQWLSGVPPVAETAADDAVKSIVESSSAKAKAQEERTALVTLKQSLVEPSIQGSKDVTCGADDVSSPHKEPLKETSAPRVSSGNPVELRTQGATHYKDVDSSGAEKVVQEERNAPVAVKPYSVEPVFDEDIAIGADDVSSAHKDEPFEETSAPGVCSGNPVEHRTQGATDTYQEPFEESNAPGFSSGNPVEPRQGATDDKTSPTNSPWKASGPSSQPAFFSVPIPSNLEDLEPIFPRSIADKAVWHYMVESSIKVRKEIPSRFDEARGWGWGSGLATLVGNPPIRYIAWRKWANVGTGGDDFGLVENAVLPVGEVGCIY